MKTYTMIIALIAACITAQAQPYRIQSGENEREKEVLFHRQHHFYATSKTSQSNILLPLEGLYYAGEWDDLPYDSALGTIRYKYHEDLTLREVFYDVFPQYINRFYAVKEEYNNTFVMEGKNMIDTATFYIISNGIYMPDKRIFFDFHYYDKFETDSFYFERTQQRWDLANKRWKNSSKDYQGFSDTILWNRTRVILYEPTESGWTPEWKFLDSLIYDEQGFVTSRMSIRYYSYLGVTDSIKYEYYLNEDGSIYAIDLFHYQNNEWVLTQRATDMTWALWLGYGGFDLFPSISHDDIPINGKRNKETSRIVWNKEGNEWEWFQMQNKYWDLDDNDSNTDTVFMSSDGGKTTYLYTSTTYRFDEYGNETEIGTVIWDYPDEEGNQAMKGSRYKMLHLYNDEGWYKSEEWFEIYNTNTHQWDSITAYKEEVTKWGDPFTGISELPQEKQSLTIAPNPASGIVIISAATEIEQLAVFDITGRLVSSQTPTSRQVTFDTGVFPKGVYLVRAVLRDGGVQTGKMVVR